MQIPYKWIAVGVVVALLVGMLGMVVWTPTTMVIIKNEIFSNEGIKIGEVQGDFLDISLAENKLTFSGDSFTRIVGVYHVHLKPTKFYMGYRFDSASFKYIDLPLPPEMIYEGNGGPILLPQLFHFEKNVPMEWAYDVVRVSAVLFIEFDYKLGDQLVYMPTSQYSLSTIVQDFTKPTPIPPKGALLVGCGSISEGVTVSISGPEQKSGVSSGGFVEFKDITPGVYSVKWSITGYVDQTTTATVTASATKQINAGTWVAGATPPPVDPGTGGGTGGTKFITITVRDSAYLTGPLISGASVTCNGVTQTTTAGVTTFTGLAAGTYVITSTKTRFNAASITVVMTPDSISASDVILMTPVSGGGGGGGGGAGNNTTATTDWLPTLILGSIGAVIFLICILAFYTRSNPVYLFLGFVALAICLIVGLMLSFNLISFDSGAVITGAVAWWK
jgi:hypothetical protein